MTIRLPSANVPIVVIPLSYGPQVTADVADAAVKAFVPFPCRILGAVVKARAIGGGTPFTDVDVQLMKNTSELVAAAPVVDGSALGGSGAGVQATLALEGADLDMDGIDDFLHLKLINVAGGASTPTLDGLEAHVYVARK